MPFLLGLDIGTSGTKTILIDETGAVVGRATVEYPLYSPRPLWSEQNPEDWWTASCATIQSVLKRAGIDPREICGIGLSGQMHGSVFLDECGEVIRPALLWNDQRTEEECAWITDTVGRERVVELTSNPVLTGFTAGKIVWLRNHEPEAYSRVRKVLLPKDFIRYRLTGEFATEVSDASGTALFNVAKREWSREMLDGCGIPAVWMAPVYESPEVSGRVNEAAAAATGLCAGTPVVGGGGDPGGRRRRQRHRRAWNRLIDGRNIRRGLRVQRDAGRRSEAAAAHILPCGSGRLAFDGRHAFGRRFAAMVSRCVLPAGEGGRRGAGPRSVRTDVRRGAARACRLRGADFSAVSYRRAVAVCRSARARSAFRPYTARGQNARGAGCSGGRCLRASRLLRDHGGDQGTDQAGPCVRRRGSEPFLASDFRRMSRATRTLR